MQPTGVSENRDVFIKRYKDVLAAAPVGCTRLPCSRIIHTVFERHTPILLMLILKNMNNHFGGFTDIWRTTQICEEPLLGLSMIFLVDYVSIHMSLLC